MKQSGQRNERGSRTEVLKPCSLRRRCQASDHSNDRRTYSRVYPGLFSYKPILPAAGQCFLQLLRRFVEQDLRLAFKSYKNLSVWEPDNTCPGTHCRAPRPSAFSAGGPRRPTGIPWMGTEPAAKRQGHIVSVLSDFPPEVSLSPTLVLTGLWDSLRKAWWGI